MYVIDRFEEAVACLAELLLVFADVDHSSFAAFCQSETFGKPGEVERESRALTLVPTAGAPLVQISTNVHHCADERLARTYPTLITDEANDSKRSMQ